MKDRDQACKIAIPNLHDRRQHSYRSADPFRDPSLAKLGGDEFIGMFPEPEMEILDSGRGFNGGNAPAEGHFNDAHVNSNAMPQFL